MHTRIHIFKPCRSLKLSVNHFFNSESHNCEPPVLLIIDCSLVQSDHINWPGGKKRAAFPFQSNIVLSGNVYLDVNQPAKVLHPASVWRVGLLALRGGNWVEEIGTLGMSETESPYCSLGDIILSSSKSGHPGCYMSSAPLNTSLPGPVRCFCDCTDYCIIVSNHNHWTTQYCF